MPLMLLTDLGQAEAVKELAKTTDIRQDLYNLQKRKVAILTSLEKKLKAAGKVI